MMMIEQRLQEVKEKLTNAQTKRIQLETRLEGLQTQKEELIKQCKEKGIEPDQLEEKVAALQSEIEQELERIEDGLSLRDQKPTNSEIRNEDMGDDGARDFSADKTSNSVKNDSEHPELPF